MKLTTRSKYGARLLLDIALHGLHGPVPSKETAEREGISLKYLEKLIKELKNAGYVRGKRGPGGGNVLTKSPEEISLGAVARILDGKGPGPECGEGPATCSRAAACLKRSIWEDADAAMFKLLDSYSLADLALDARLCPKNPPDPSRP